MVEKSALFCRYALLLDKSLVDYEQAELDQLRARVGYLERISHE